MNTSQNGKDMLQIYLHRVFFFFLSRGLFSLKRILFFSMIVHDRTSKTCKLTPNFHVSKSSSKCILRQVEFRSLPFAVILKLILKSTVPRNHLISQQLFKVFFKSSAFPLARKINSISNLALLHYRVEILSLLGFQSLQCRDK